MKKHVIPAAALAAVSIAIAYPQVSSFAAGRHRHASHTTIRPISPTTSRPATSSPTAAPTGSTATSGELQPAAAIAVPTTEAQTTVAPTSSAPTTSAPTTSATTSPTLTVTSTTRPKSTPKSTPATSAPARPAVATPTSSLPTSGAVKAFDACFSCFGQTPTLAWFQQQKAAGYELAILDPDTWDSEFSDANGTQARPASACALDSNGLTEIGYAISAGMHVALYNRSLNCYKQTLTSLDAGEKQGVSAYIFDVETAPGLIPTQAQVSDAASMGFTVGMYTWDGAVSNLGTSFSNLPLFMDAVSDWNTPDAGPPTGNYPTVNAISAFSGWKSAVIEQVSTGKLGGMSVDFDAVSAAWLRTLRSGAA